VTSDGHGTSYFGKIVDVNGLFVTLANTIWWSGELPEVDFHKDLARKKPSGEKPPHEHFIAKRAENLRRRQHNPLPTDTWSQTSKQIRVAADTPDTTEQKGQISPTGTPLRGHQTIILPCVGANLSNGH
jgi:hypothetical protein